MVWKVLEGWIELVQNWVLKIPRLALGMTIPQVNPQVMCCMEDVLLVVAHLVADTPPVSVLVLHLIPPLMKPKKTESEAELFN